MRCVLVSHTHWDREWYRTFQSFRARLVDTIDRVLELVAEDPGFYFQLDGQTIVLEDYVAIRPERRDELAAACRAGRVAIGPWYVQPDSLLPSGEAHVRNLLEGRRVANEYGSCATVAYTPDSFGHPAQFPQIFSGFGLGPFIYWRGNGNEIAELPSEYVWIAPDGSRVPACHLAKGYFNAWGLAADVDAAARRLEEMARDLVQRSTRSCALLMNGLDHMLPDSNTREAALALAKRTGWEVERGLLDDYTGALDLQRGDLPEFAGELCGGRVANLLPGVWSTHSDLKLRNRRCESLLEGWAEPWAALGEALGTPPERAALRGAWRDLLANQAHDSICGCSQDRVHAQMISRYDAAEELASETTSRSLERIAGLPVTRQIPVGDATDTPKDGDPPLAIAIFNPSPYPRTDVVSLPLSGFPSFTSSGINPLLASNRAPVGFTIDGQAARLQAYDGTARPSLVPGEPVHDLEFVAYDVPGFGWKRVVFERGPASPDRTDDGRSIEAGDVRVQVADDGSFDVDLAGRRYRGLAAVEDSGDRGDTYDHDRAPAGRPADLCEPSRIEVRRLRHESGIERLIVTRTFEIPARLTDDRRSRSSERAELLLRIEARVAPGVDRVDLQIHVDDRAQDHRVRLLFPSGGPAPSFDAATTFDVARRSREKPDDSQWVHPAPSTFPHQGWISVNGLTVAAPGLYEGELTGAGAIAVTLLRAVGWLSRPDLASRRGEAGPALPTPGAQCPAPLEARISLLACRADERLGRARDAELGLRAVAAGDGPLVEPERPLLEVTPKTLVVSALKPAGQGDGCVLRLLNPESCNVTARVRIGFPCSEIRAVRLDETPADLPVREDADSIELEVPAHALRSLLLRARRSE